MFAKTSVFVLLLASFQIALSYVAANAYRGGICEAPALAGIGSERVRLTPAPDYEAFLSKSVKEVPAICMGDGLVYRFEVEEPSKDDEVMNDARTAIGETSPQTVEDAKEKLVELLKKDSKLNTPLDNSEWLVRFLRFRKYDVKATYELIKNYYNFKAQNKKLLDGLVPTAEIGVVESNVFGVLPKRDQDGSRITVFSAKNWNPKSFQAIDVLKASIVLTELGSYEPATQIGGVQIIVDVNGMTMNHVKQLTPSITKKIMDYSKIAAPYRSVKIHFVNQSRFFAKAFNLMKPFLSKEDRDRIFLHGNNLKSLHQHISPSILPDIYGGSYPMLKLSSAEWNVLLKNFDEEFAKINTYGVKKN